MNDSNFMPFWKTKLQGQKRGCQDWGWEEGLTRKRDKGTFWGDKNTDCDNRFMSI